jgi:hypothetical protein
MTMPAHAPYAPSSFNRLMACGGSHELAAHYPEPDEDEDEGDGEAAREGTAAHWCGELLLTGQPLPAIGSKHANGIVIDKDMHDCAEIYADYVRSIVPPTAKIEVEQRVLCGIIHKDCWGTFDARAFHGDQGYRYCDVFDYKHGHAWVNEYENWQGVGYGAGSLDMQTEVPSIDDSYIFRFHIIQPRAYTRGGKIARMWEVPAGRFMEYVMRLRNRIQDIARGGMPCTTGEYCHYCPARRGCEALHVAAQHAAQITRGAQPLDLTPAQAGVELSILMQAKKALDYRIKGLEAQVEHDLVNHKAVPFWQMERVEGREKWKQSDADVIKFGALLGVNLAKPAEVITPTQARKLVPSPTMLNNMTDRPHSIKLREIDQNATRRIFEQS